MNYNLLRAKEVFFILTLSTGLFNHVILIPLLLEAAGRDAWLSVITAFFPFLLFIWIIYYINKNTNQENISDWLKKRYGKLMAALIALPLILILFVHASITFINTSYWAEIYFLPTTPSFLISSVLLISCYLLSSRKLKILAIMSTIVLPMVVFLGFFIMSVNTTEKDPEYLFPLFLNGYVPFFKGIFFSLSGLTEIFVIILIQHKLNQKIQFKQIFWLGVVLLGLTFGPLSAAIMEFGPVEARNFAFPAYEEWKLLKIGEFISRLDFLAMFQWISGAFFRIGLFMYIINHYFNKRKSKLFLPFLYLIIYGFSFLKLDTYDINKFQYLYFLPFSLIIVVSITTVLFILVLLSKRREKAPLERS
ncbi:GerAB/ArcD/ProY family transporter [Mesobacillus jeotgali]|uniref:GerAB/ArcD/ProY family transporter n=1 Tax=Mesobacillus jeotgali TaxID=129985 RepID=UPI001591170D|nr:endospore germination permease [Mesobacillus jeotgali]